MPFCFRESWVFTACLTLVKATAERHLARTHAAAAAAERDFYRLQVSRMSKDVPFLDASGDPWEAKGTTNFDVVFDEGTHSPLLDDSIRCRGSCA
jgi:hypothetical protein